MFSLRSALLSLLCLILWAPPLHGQDLSRYRDFQLGMTVADVSHQARVSATAARALHERPKLIQELDWLPQLQRERPAEAESVRMVRFTFYDGRLYKMVVTYDRNRIEGLTGADLAEAMSASYGAAILASTQIGGAQPAALDTDTLSGDRTIAAQWEDADYSVRLLRTSYPSSFELLLVSKRPEQLAQAATLSSTRLDLLAAPQAEIDRQQKLAAENRAKAEKARLANKPLFRF
jgi:hypothetical protein